MKLSELYGRHTTLGTVMSVYIDGERIVALLCFDEKEKEFFCKHDLNRLEGLPEGCRKLSLGRAVFSEDGKFLGNLTDCTYRQGRLRTAKVGKKSYPFSLLEIGDVIILKNKKSSAELAAKDMLIDVLLGE